MRSASATTAASSNGRACCSSCRVDDNARVPRVRTLEQAAAFIDRVGIALVFGKTDVVLPSLWDEICGPSADWAVRDESGKAVAFTPEFERLWHWKDDLPERRLVCAGRHLARDAAALISPRLVPAVYAFAGRRGGP